MSINPRKLNPGKAAVTKVQRCVMTLGGLSVLTGAALTFGLAGSAAAQTAATTSAVAVQAPKTDGMPMPHPHHLRRHHHECDHGRDRDRDRCHCHHGHWDRDGGWSS